MEDMMKMYRMAQSDDEDFAFPLDMALVLNTEAPLIKKLIRMQESSSEKATALATQIYRLALLSHRRLSADELKTFLEDSYGLLLDLGES